MKSVNWMIPVLIGLGNCASAFADPPEAVLPSTLRTMTLEQAVRYGLEHNPQLTAIRQQHGIAAAGVVLARTYPFNPVTQSTVFGINGPAAAGIDNRVGNQHKITLEIQILGQQSYRRQAAYANLTRAEFEIANQEVIFAINEIRAFDTYLYRKGKLELTEDFLRLNQHAVNQIQQLVAQGSLRVHELILVRADVSDMMSQIGLGRTALSGARRDFIHATGTLDLGLEPDGTLDRPLPSVRAERLLEAALQQRPDLLARQAAVTQAESQLRYDVADRFGNPVVGPVYEYNETRVNFIGVQFGTPIPVFNRKQGEIQQRRADLARAHFELQQTETEIRQDVPTVLGRVTEARSWMESYERQALPDLTRALADIEELFRHGQAGVDVLRVVDIRRRLLRAREGYLDAQFAYTQALCDLAQAVGDAGLAMGLYQPESPPAAAKP